MGVETSEFDHRGTQLLYWKLLKKALQLQHIEVDLKILDENIRKIDIL